MNRRTNQISKRNLISFSDLKRGLNFSKNFSKFQGFFDLIMESVFETIELDNFLIVYQNEKLKTNIENNCINQNNKDQVIWNR